jgi:hypothetical protein
MQDAAQSRNCEVESSSHSGPGTKCLPKAISGIDALIRSAFTTAKYDQPNRVQAPDPAAQPFRRLSEPMGQTRYRIRRKIPPSAPHSRLHEVVITLCQTQPPETAQHSCRTYRRPEFLLDFAPLVTRIISGPTRSCEPPPQPFPPRTHSSAAPPSMEQASLPTRPVGVCLESAHWSRPQKVSEAAQGGDVATALK